MLLLCQSHILISINFRQGGVWFQQEAQDFTWHPCNSSIRRRPWAGLCHAGVPITRKIVFSLKRLRGLRVTSHLLALFFRVVNMIAHDKTKRNENLTENIISVNVKKIKVRRNVSISGFVAALQRSPRPTSCSTGHAHRHGRRGLGQVGWGTSVRSTHGSRWSPPGSSKIQKAITGRKSLRFITSFRIIVWSPYFSLLPDQALWRALPALGHSCWNKVTIFTECLLRDEMGARHRRP